MHKVIIIPGLSNDAKKITWATHFWKKYELDPVVHSVGWHDTNETFTQKLEKLLNRIDQFSKEGHMISLVGTSAGGSAVINAFMRRKDSVSHVVNVSGRLRVGTYTGIHSFEARTASSLAFAESVQMCERGLSNLTPEDKKRIMTIHPLLGDELVPANTVIIDEAQNIVIPSGEHVLSIAMALTLFSRPLIQFLNRNTS